RIVTVIDEHEPRPRLDQATGQQAALANFGAPVALADAVRLRRQVERPADGRRQEHLERPAVLPAERLARAGLVGDPQRGVEALSQRTPLAQARRVEAGLQAQALLVELVLAGLLDAGREVLVARPAAGAKRGIASPQPAAHEHVDRRRPGPG